MKTVEKMLLLIILFTILTDVNSVYAQSQKSNLKTDSTQKDKTRVVKEKNIKDTSLYNPVGDTAVKAKVPGKKKQKDKTMQMVPNSEKKKTTINKSN
ncbi:MAG TPA: hypothetical protein VHO90_04895 [Bacteroidales bacterium]|nr:hypothetical protein [Bacteroidales bacterium]